MWKKQYGFSAGKEQGAQLAQLARCDGHPVPRGLHGGGISAAKGENLHMFW